MQYVAKINCAFNIISIANVGRSENIAKQFHKYLHYGFIQIIVINKSVIYMKMF